MTIKIENRVADVSFEIDDNLTVAEIANLVRESLADADFFQCDDCGEYHKSGVRNELCTDRYHGNYCTDCWIDNGHMSEQEEDDAAEAAAIKADQQWLSARINR